MCWSVWATRLPSLQPQHEEGRPDLCPRGVYVCAHPPVALRVCFSLGCDHVKSKIHQILFCFLSFHSWHIYHHTTFLPMRLCFCVEVNTKNDTDSLSKMILDLKVMKALKIPTF